MAEQPTTLNENLERIRLRLLEKEKYLCASYACTSPQSLGRKREPTADIRPDFVRDRDKIIHSNAFFRMSGKTQVFMSPRNPLISSRMTHVIQVAQIAKAIARGIDANEDLAEAMALGHDLGHAPFGHTGEKLLSKKCLAIGLPEFHHNMHSLRVVDTVEKNGRGLNLTWEVREGIVCHDGEVQEGEIRPTQGKAVDRVELYTKEEYKKPAVTLEGCIVKISDKIAYVGKDVEDAIEAGILRKEDLPREYFEVMGYTNAEIINSLVNDIVENFHSDLAKFREKNRREPVRHEVSIRLTPRIRAAMDGLIFKYNYKNIYLSKANLRYSAQTATIISDIFDHYYTEARSLKYSRENMGLDQFTNGGDERALSIFRNSLNSKTLGEIEDLMKVHENEFSERFFLDLFDDDEKAAAGEFFHARTVAELKKMMSESLRNAKLAILRSSLDKWLRDQPRLPSILSFVHNKVDDYLLANSCGYYVMDFVASLTDRLAIDMFEAIKIPESIA